jgi:hypothetical protein
MRSFQQTVTATAAQLIAADNIPRVAYINIVGNESIAVGNSSVTFATGLQVAKHTAPFQINVPFGESLWAICDTGKTDDVRVLLPDAD